MDSEIKDYIPRLLLLAPLIFVCHFLEEGPRLVEWFNSHVARGITVRWFWSVNLTALAITAIIVAVEWVARSEISLVLAVAWLSFLMLANALFHIVGALKDGGYVPGLVTAVVLYLPYYFWLMSRIIQSKQIHVGIVVGAALLGSIPMVIHGYLIVFLRSRLF